MTSATFSVNPAGQATVPTSAENPGVACLKHTRAHSENHCKLRKKHWTATHLS
jgi:hypothetical protein